MRKALFLPLILLALALTFAACGSGGSSSSGTMSASTSTPESTWAKEVEKVMRRFENQVSANATEQIHNSSSQPLLEPLYRVYGAALTKLGNDLGATKAPSGCVALRRQMADDAHALGQLTTKLGHEGNVEQEEFSALVVQQESKMHRYGRDLTQITYRPHC